MEIFVTDPSPPIENYKIRTSHHRLNTLLVRLGAGAYLALFGPTKVSLITQYPQLHRLTASYSTGFKRNTKLFRKKMVNRQDVFPGVEPSKD